MGYHNRDHKHRRIVSKYKFQRILGNNLENAGVAFRIKDGETQTSSSACKVGDVIYAYFTPRNNNLKETIYIRYNMSEVALDCIAFAPYNSYLMAFLDLYANESPF